MNDSDAVTGLKKNIIDKFEKYGDLDELSQELIEAAVKARRFAYVPYSNFRVGAAFRTKCGRIFTGCNVENSGHSPASCAERTAITKAVSEGFSEFAAGAVVAFQKDSITTPCGVCRQVILEFANEDIPIMATRVRTNGTDDQVDANEMVLCTSAYNLLPYRFRTYL